MSWITFDFHCHSCGAEYPDMLVRRSDIDDQECEQCLAPLQRMLAAPKTTFKFADGPKKETKKASPGTTTLKLEK